jgi:cell division protein FtsB
MPSRAKVYKINPRKVAKLRLERLAVVLIIFSLVFLWMTAPTLKLIKERSLNGTLKQQLKARLFTNKDLLSDIQKLKKPSYIEFKARKDLGLVKEGEIQYYVLTKKTKLKTKLKKTSKNWWGKFSDFLEFTFAK